ncbi:carboxylesterase family protein [Actinocrispum wychmicini]|uniref:Carboxylesterase family protein n=1 Tax=Actinocrispum wychmicini TaxID=1213861 RepID=A0A4R2K3C8_9PSEU|nr:carboxylesterase family protein [Actinocrispum wychmicini]
MAVAVTTDAGFRMPTIAIATAMADHDNVYAYRYDRPTIYKGRDLGAPHGAELPYVFATDSEIGRRLAGDYDPEFADVVNSMWRAFVTDGRPAHDWPRYPPATRSTMLLEPTGHQVWAATKGLA